MADQRNGEFFTEPDESRAIQHFLEQTSEQKPIVKIVSTSKVASFAAADVELKAAAKRRGESSQILIRRGDHWELRLSTPVEENAYWARVTTDLLERRELVAAKTGIAAVAWLPDLKKPTDSPKLCDLIDLYTKKPKLTSVEVGRSKLFWREFTSWSGVATLRDITHTAVQQYESKVSTHRVTSSRKEGAGRTKKLSAKSVKHRFSKVRCVVAYALKRGVDAPECRRVLDVLAMLESPDASPLAPHPISPKDLWIFYRAALRAEDQEYAALLLGMLNLAMYPGEISALRWDEANLDTGEVVTRRPKTGVVRVGILWPETIAALKALPHEREQIFCSRRRSFTAQLVWHWWKRYRDQVKLPLVKPSDIRDASYTIACQVSTLDKAKVLAGHRFSGVSDAYIQRNPQFVADACTAIAKAFDVAQNVQKIALEVAAAKKADKQ